MAKKNTTERQRQGYSYIPPSPPPNIRLRGYKEREDTRQHHGKKIQWKDKQQ